MKKAILNIFMGVILLLSLLSLKLLGNVSNKDAENVETESIEENNDSQGREVE